ncbi:MULTISPECIES: hypothetical protein [Streptococcus]|uniref:Uncharacterized protein n=1 Tax=Streptococcus caledonicus TaxID=2614158 RepID=A0ABW0UCB0_9STRE|nr:hypothetical protein [Streptococcus sp. S784/96/1]
MKNRVIDVFNLKDKEISIITVDNPDFSDLRIGGRACIQNKEYSICSIAMINRREPMPLDTFVIPITQAELVGKQVTFKK